MEANDSETAQSSENYKSSGSRHSTRPKKSISFYAPEIHSTKTRKPEYGVSCEITKSKGLKVKKKTVKFEIAENLPARKLVRSFLKEINFMSNKCIILYYCEETQSNQYLEWQKFKASDIFNIGSTCKIRVYRNKKLNEKIETSVKPIQTPTEKPKIVQKPETIPKSVDMFQNYMIMMNYYQQMMMYQVMMSQQPYT